MCIRGIGGTYGEKNDREDISDWLTDYVPKGFHLLTSLAVIYLAIDVMVGNLIYRRDISKVTDPVDYPGP